jgi:hypothetical protein
MRRSGRRRGTFLAASAAAVCLLGDREARADAVLIEKVPRSPLRSIFTIPRGAGRGPVGHTQAHESAPRGPASLFVTPDHDIHGRSR